MLGDMMQNAESFRGEDYILKESSNHYFVDPDAPVSVMNTEY